jgi:predicted nuclease of predicted toxin-antitoxin system
MNFLIDENVGHSVADFLIRKGHDVVEISQGDHLSREDIFLAELAFKEDRIIITNDKDFGFLVYRQKLPSRGIILFRFLEERPSLKIAALEKILSLPSHQIKDHFIVVSDSKIRIRPIRRII